MAISQAIRRARKELAEAAHALDGKPANRNLIIENARRGYRVNPMVRVVTLEELQQL